MQLLAVPVPRVLLPGGRIEIRLERSVWQSQLDDGRPAAVAAFYRAGHLGAWPDVGTLAVIVGRRGEGDQIYLRLNGLRRIRTARALSHAPGVVEVAGRLDAADPEALSGGGTAELADEIVEVQTLVRRYHAAVVEHGERADIGVELPTEPEAAAYRVASLLRVSEPERQFLLEAETTHDRLRRVTAALRREIELLRRTMGPKGA